MKLINFIIWLSAGAVIGWLAGRMVKIEHKRVVDRLVPVKVSSSESS